MNRRIEAPWLSASATQAVFAALEAGGYTVRAVGGIVRNTLLGLPATDIDFATNALPAQTMRLAEAAQLKTVATGLAHGTVTVISAGVPFEVTTLRRDVATDGRHAQVAFTDDWTADAARRDFTINALYCSRTGEIFDPLQGVGDLDPVRIRFIGSAAERICEDYLRILRFFRFTAAYCADGVLDAEGLSACIAHRVGLARISGERIRTELLKLFCAPHAVAVTRTLIESRVFSVLFAQTPLLGAFSRLVEIEEKLGLKPDPLLRLSALAVTSREDAAQLHSRLKFSAREFARLSEAASNGAGVVASLSAGEAKRILYELGIPAYLDAVLLSWAHSNRPTNDGAFLELATLPDRWTPPVFSLTGADVRALGIPAGPQIGELLAQMESDWIASGFALSREELLAELKARVGRMI